MIFIVCQRVILIYFSTKLEMVARLRGHDRIFCHVQRERLLNNFYNLVLIIGFTPWLVAFQAPALYLHKTNNQN